MTTSTKEEQQKYYDALLIRGWRQFQNLVDVHKAFKSIFGVYPNEAGLLRTFSYSKVGVRNFVAKHLPKINDRLLTQNPDKDVLLLRKLQTSSYTTLKSGIQDSSITAESNELRKRRAVLVFDGYKSATRNRDTNWNVTK